MYQKNIFFEKTISAEEIFPKKKWSKKFSNYWIPSEENANIELKKFVKDKLREYSNLRNFPYVSGTSRLSPFIKHGQIHVETIWEECMKIKGSSNSKYLAEIGWREFNYSLINYFPHMLSSNYSKKFDKLPWEKNIKFLSAWKKV